MATQMAIPLPTSNDLHRTNQFSSFIESNLYIFTENGQKGIQHLGLNKHVRSIRVLSIMQYIPTNINTGCRYYLQKYICCC